VGGPIERQGPHRQFSRRLASSSHQALDAGDEFVGRERLGETRDSAELPPPDPIPFGIAGRKQEDWRGIPAPSHAAHDLEPVPVRQTQIQHHGGWRLPLQHSIGLEPAVDEAHGHSTRGQCACNAIRQHAVILHHEDDYPIVSSLLCPVRGAMH
jgi:hypothetical protein